MSFLAAIGTIFHFTPKRRAIWIAVAVYFIGAILSVFAVGIGEMKSITESGVGDPQLVAGAIAEAVVKEGLAAMIFIPVLIITYIVLKKRRTKIQGL